jgi:hypothetical protein
MCVSVCVQLTWIAAPSPDVFEHPQHQRVRVLQHVSDRALRPVAVVRRDEELLFFLEVAHWCEIFVRRVQTTQKNVTRALGPPTTPWRAAMTPLSSDLWSVKLQYFDSKIRVRRAHK